MRSDWLAFLTQAGAVPGNDRVMHFGDPRRELQSAVGTDILCDLSHQGLIAASGPDTETFLQGQVTCDVRQVSSEHSQLGAYCSPKGRMLASFRLFRRGEHYYLGLPRERVEPIIKRLRTFVLRAKTSLEDASDELVRIGLSGPDAARLLKDALGLVPARADNVVQVRELSVVCLQGVQPRFEIIGRIEDQMGLWTILSEQATPVGADPWRLLDILAGIPTLYTSTAEAFIPQMTNLQLLHGISLRKGCYSGQEVVARTHYLGKLKRRMYRAHIDTSVRPQPGDELFSPQVDATQSVGKIVDACPHPEGGFEALAVVLIDCAEGATVLLGDARGPHLEFAPLPYAFEEPAA